MMQLMQDEVQQMLAKDLGLADLSSAEQKMLIEQFGLVALKSATIAVLEQMPEDKREEYTKLAEAGDAPTLKAFLDTAVPNHEQLVQAAIAEEVKEFRALQAGAATV
jgi:hypothetical protein